MDLGVARGAKGHKPPKFLEYLVVLCIERHWPKPNTVARLKASIWTLPNFELATRL